MKNMFLITLAIIALSLSCSTDSGTNQSSDGDQDLSDLEAELEYEFEDASEDDAEEVFNGPSDDPNDYQVDSSKVYSIEVSEPRWVVPSDGLPDSLELEAANNNLDIIFHEGRLFMGWRTAPFHFASAETRMLIVSSTDMGVNWDFENDIAIGTDLREPRLLAYKDRLHIYYFEAGADMLSFEPKHMWRATRLEDGSWEAPVIAVDQPEVPWDLKVRNGKAYMTSYMGNHYESGESAIEVYFKVSEDGVSFTKVDDKPYVYKGGVSEVAFEFDVEGNLWAVTRNEDGDSSGFGSHVCFAPKEALSEWECSEQSDPERYDSPDMFRHGEEIYLVARRDVGGPYDEDREDLTFEEQKSKYLVDYSFRPKGTSLYHIDRQNRKVEKVLDLPGCGDNAFPSVRRLDAHNFLLANYTSPLDMTDSNWLDGQTSSRGTQIYLLTVTFVPEE